MPYYDTFSNLPRTRLASEHVYRIGPAPREEVDLTKDRKEGPKVKECEAEIGSLDGNLETIHKGTNMSAPSKTLLIYFAKMAKKSNHDTVDYNFLSSLIKSGASVNVSDQHGQSVMHEVARNWCTDVAKFFILNGVDVNKADNWGRTPLHLAAAVNYSEMVEYLIKSGGDAMARTKGEKQTPMHYAAKYNAVSSLRVLIDSRVDYNCRDFKGRTPIFLAAEMAQEDSARYLLDIGVPVGVFDDTGMSAIGLMVEKIPQVAVDGLNQFRTFEPAFRRESYYLNYLEYSPETGALDGERSAELRNTEDSTEELNMSVGRRTSQYVHFTCPTTALEMAVQYSEDDVIMHPAMQQLIRTKWDLFGKVGAILEFSLHLLFCLVWTVLGLLLPRDGKFYETGFYWRVPTEAFGVLIAFLFILKQIWESKVSMNRGKRYRVWKANQIRRDLVYCHPRWCLEEEFLEHERRNIQAPCTGFLQNPWNILACLNLLSVSFVIGTRVACIFLHSTLIRIFHMRAYSFALIFMWLHFMKSCRPFTTVGLFIAMLEHVAEKMLVFLVVCFDMMVPLTIGLWILFGGHVHAKTMKQQQESPTDWELFNNFVFTVWQIMVVADFNIEAIFAVDRHMAQVVVGMTYALCRVICLNIHIALVFETFRKVYNNARATTSRLQASTVLQIERVLTKNKLRKVREHIETHCAPLVLTCPNDKTCSATRGLAERTIRTILLRLDVCKEKMLNGISKKRLQNRAENTESQMEKERKEREILELYQGLISRHEKIYELRVDIYQLKCIVLKYLDGPQVIPRKPRHEPPPFLDLRSINSKESIELDCKTAGSEASSVSFSEDIDVILSKMRTEPECIDEEDVEAPFECIDEPLTEELDWGSLDVDSTTDAMHEDPDPEDSCKMS